jgi:hypothetical protein
VSATRSANTSTQKQDVRQNSADRAGQKKTQKEPQEKEEKQENAKEERRLTEALFGSQDEYCDGRAMYRKMAG